jgi:outer membrane lipoprotein SlyB
MKYPLIGLTTLSAMLVLTGCYTPEGRPDRTASGALGGGVIGAGTGAIIGGAAGNPGAGAAIGGAIGAITGGIIGNSIDQAQRERLVQQSPQTMQRVDQGQPLGLADIKALARAGVSDEVIISQIRNARTVYRLTTAEIIELKDAGVSERVIDFMINTPNLSSAAPPGPVAQPEENVYVAEAPPPAIYEEYVAAPGPGFIWISGNWGWRGGRWVWVGGRWARPPYRRAYWVPGRWVPYGRRYAWRPGRWR